LEILEKNGFRVKINESMPSGQQCQLVGLPFVRLETSKKTSSTSDKKKFDLDDLNELLNLIHETPGNKSSIRCSKVRATLASRACRDSIMIGMPLKQARMKQIVQRLAGLDKPWNCPHGRPTLRHLTSIDLRAGFKSDLEVKD
jgi:DNA mismatch repair protein PMS2